MNVKWIKVFLLINKSFLRPEKVDQALVTPKFSGEVEEAFRVAVNGFV